VVDVTGHGIAAALTVNRLHGELERLFAENPDVDPGAVLGLLNKYVHLTLANHSVYATAFCLRVDPARNVVEYASGGHPPAFLRAVDGTLHELSSTGFVLGACPSDDFDPAPATLPFYPGDALIVYTDGAIEAKNEAGRMLGVRGVQRLLAQKAGASPGQWPAVLMQTVDGHRVGPVCDDTLAVEVWRPLASELASDDAGAWSRTSAVLHAPQGAAR
jgi:sigma-B regulation protein RsbU (phosphoserine phosphatase)